MSAHCHDCGADLAFDLSCGRCDMKAERDRYKQERDELRKDIARSMQPLYNLAQRIEGESDRG